MSDPEILVDVSDRIATVTLNRPSKLNALNLSLLAQLEQAFATDFRDRGDIGVVILTGAGEKAFAAGADIGEMASLNPVEAHQHARRGQRVLETIEAFDRPVIAAVNGFALGGGCELSLAAHLRLAADNASFGQPEVSIGLMPGFGGTQRLARLVGRARALDLILTGRRIDAAEALAFGLVNRVVPVASLMAEARKLATEILARAPLAVRYSLEAVRHGLEAGFDEGARLEATLFGLLFSTADMKEGTQAFVEKRKASFSGR